MVPVSQLPSHIFLFIFQISIDHNQTINNDNLFLEHPKGLTNKYCKVLGDS